MREIQYRAWHKDGAYMMPVEEIDFENKLINKSGAWRWFNELELMQSTGLKDKNGVEIFEGDIVRYTWDLPNDINATEKGKKIRVSKVFWSDWRASFAVGKKSVNSDLFGYVRNGNTVEVIGNIYENSDLI